MASHPIAVQQFNGFGFREAERNKALNGIGVRRGIIEINCTEDDLMNCFIMAFSAGISILNSHFTSLIAADWRQ